MSRLNATKAEIDEYLRLLDATPRRIGACTEEASEAQLAQSPDRQGWSAAQVLGHLRACAELWSFSIYAMLAQGNPTLMLADERKWAKTRGFDRFGFRKSFLAFALGREELMGVLRELPLEAWERTAVIENRSHSVFSQVRRMALHEAEHCDQIELLLV